MLQPWHFASHWHLLALNIIVLVDPLLGVACASPVTTLVVQAPLLLRFFFFFFTHDIVVNRNTVASQPCLDILLTALSYLLIYTGKDLLKHSSLYKHSTSYNENYRY